jgi:hypothetical protein
MSEFETMYQPYAGEYSPRPADIKKHETIGYSTVDVRRSSRATRGSAGGAVEPRHRAFTEQPRQF